MLDADIVYDLALAVPQRGHEYMVPEHSSVRLVLSKVHRCVGALRQNVNSCCSEATETSIAERSAVTTCMAKQNLFLPRHWATLRDHFSNMERVVTFVRETGAFFHPSDKKYHVQLSAKRSFRFDICRLKGYLT